MVFRGLEIDFDIFDADTAEAYENALKHVQTSMKPSESETWSGCIRRVCNEIFDFFDTLIEPGIHKELFGDSVHYTECLDAFQEFNGMVIEQKTKLEKYKSTPSAALPGSKVRRVGK